MLDIFFENPRFDDLVAANANFNIKLFLEQFGKNNPILKGRIDGEDTIDLTGFGVTVYLNQVLTRYVVLIASEDKIEELSVSDLSYGTLFRSIDKNYYCWETQCYFDGEIKRLEVFLSEEEAKYAIDASIQRFKTLEDAKKAFDSDGEKYLGKNDYELVEVNSQKVFLCGTCIPYEDIIYPAFENLMEELYKQFPEFKSLNVDLDSSELRDYYLDLLLKEDVRFEEVCDEF